MSLAIEVEITRDDATPFIHRYLDTVRDLTGLNAAIAEEERDMVRDYLIEVVGKRHDTAEGLGAAPTGHWGRAAETLAATGVADAAIVSIHDPAASRAAHDVTILPKDGKQWLTIPLIAAAYNKMARTVEGLFRPFAKVTGYTATKEGAGFAHSATGAGAERMRVLARKGPEGKLEFWYALVESITQRQDRTLLPPDEAIRLTAIRAVKDYLAFRFGRIAA